MPTRTRAQLRNAQSVPFDSVPVLSLPAFRDVVIEAVRNGERIAALFGMRRSDCIRLIGVLAQDGAGTLSVTSADVHESYLSLTPECVQAHWFEREIAEQWGIHPEGHPWLKPIRCHDSYSSRQAPWRRNATAEPPPGVADFYRIEGDEVHEVAVGPVHAGIIEPGHFRFQCHGEHVHHLEIILGYQHRGVESALVGGPHKRTIHHMETLAGDTTVGHTMAYCQNYEALCRCRVPARAQALRAVALELERLANHTGDLGALAGDVGYLPTASYCGRIRGDFLNMSAMLCGNRFSRGLVRPGGVACDVSDTLVTQLESKLDTAMKDVGNAVDLLWSTATVMARFEETGQVSEDTARRLGLVGVAARACGIERDVRIDFPTGLYGFLHIPMATWHTGDVFARALVRWLEIQRSTAFVQTQLRALPEGPARASCAALEPGKLAVSLVEGWRGEVCHVAVTDEQGRFAAYKVVDPSFHNWMGLAMALRGQQISDFPLCNKSFNLSYCGHDL